MNSTVRTSTTVCYADHVPAPALPADCTKIEGASEHFEVFALLPIGYFCLEALDLGEFDVGVIVDHCRAHGVAEERIVLQREHRLAQRFWQQRGVALVRRVRRRAGIQRPIDAIEAGK